MVSTPTRRLPWSSDLPSLGPSPPYSVFLPQPWQLAVRKQKRAPKAARSRCHTQCRNPRWTSLVTLAASRAQRVGAMRQSWLVLRNSCMASP
jgi:hypothetical protein